MAEHSSRQKANITAGTRMKPAEVGGKVRCLIITSPADADWAQNDTLASGVPLPIGTRILGSSIVSHGALGASVTMDIGLREYATGTAIDLDGIASNLDVSAAGRTAANNGALVAGGAEYITSVVSEVYVTLGGANPTDDAQFRVEIYYLSTD